MSVDSGLPDFRSDGGLWKAYPAYAKLGHHFTELATPKTFTNDPELAWGFYGHRANLYQSTQPHGGHAILKNWVELFDMEYFVVTSNVDGHFEKAGFETSKIAEIHGSITHLQCSAPCRPEIWLNDSIIPLDEIEMRARWIPICPSCGQAARPNILMFADFQFIPRRVSEQEGRLQRFLQQCPSPIVILEVGAGKFIPTIRWMAQEFARQHHATIIRINPDASEISTPHISLPYAALEALTKMQTEMLLH
jgi:NAD-dependent SIR2 family protein deacetylase